MIAPRIACAVIAVLLSACGGGGGGGSAIPPNTAAPVATPTPPGTVTTESVTGTLTIGNPGSTALGVRRSPLFVSAATRHAALFIDGATTAAGSTTTCSATTGTGTGCTITWAARLSVPNAHTFAVEADSGPSGTPANTVLSEGAGSYGIVAGTNTLSALSLNGVAATATFTVGICGATFCPGTITIAGSGGYAIAYNGVTAVPTAGNLPSSGNVFDNGSAQFVSSAPTYGTVTGTAQAPFSTLTAATLTVAGVDTTGIYSYQVTCVAAASGAFGITIAGGTTPSGAVSAAEIAALSPAVTYPTALAVSGSPPAFTCTAGNIGSATGTIPVN